ncbi:MAG: beta-ketoacyl synthase N-terminal-like domain-containing protein [Gammaproteobacteria bacterium]|nr:beta-ketoacyl synthase N-terminal-like domain-containing protein [Gammaproteobacteria bacterium]
MSEQATLQKALYTIKKLKSLLEENKSHAPQPIAIIGMSSRFPTATGKDEYWKMLCEGRNIISSLPEKRWDLLKGTHEYEIRDALHPYYGGYLSDIDLFDAYFFGISPREAQRIDPQHRLLLEVAYEAFEDAGIPIEKLAGSNTGVFSSLYMSQLGHMQHMDTEMDALFFPTGNAISIAANRISYLFDLHGPSIIVDSACSSSMASLQLACLNLQNKVCDLAVVCGAKLNLLPYVNYVLTKAKMLSIDGQCKTFDADANGYVQGEGVGVIVLKPLSQALKDADRIYGVITGTAVNQDGKTNGLTAPNGLQQELLLKAAYQAAKINPEDISYVECHGTGTFLGDPIELEALGEVVGKNRDKDHPCWIGSVKTNIGHLEPAAGIAGIMKVALALQHGQIPPHLNYFTPNPHIQFDKYHFSIPQKMQEWPRYGSHRTAGISGFGFGGTNSHVVMRELAEDEKPVIQHTNNHSTELFTLSAKDPAALSLYVNKWCDFIDNNASLDLTQICYNLHTRRSHYFCRLGIVANSIHDLYEKLCTLKSELLIANQYTDSIFINLNKDKMSHLNNETELQKLAVSYMNRDAINWKTVEEYRLYPNMDLPLYPWQHKHYWPPLVNNHSSAAVVDPYPLQGKHIPSPLNTLQFEFLIDVKRMPDVEDTYNVVHAGYYMEIFAYAVKYINAQATFTIEDHAFLSPLFAQNDAVVTVQLIVEKSEQDVYVYHIYSRVKDQKNWVNHAKGVLILNTLPEKVISTVDEIKKRCHIHGSAEKMYERITAMGMPTGESIRWTQQYWQNEKEILCEFKQPLSTQDKNNLYVLQLHPGVFDGSIQPVFMLLPDEHVKPYIASGAKRVNFYGMRPGPYFLYGVMRSITESGDKIICDCYLMTEQGVVIAEFDEMGLAQLDDKVQIQKMMEEKDRHVKVDLTTLDSIERKKYVMNFLTEQCANIFSIPKEEIEVNRSLQDMGIDSLMAIVLMRTLEMGLGISYSMHDLLEGPTITELCDFVLSTVSPVQSTTPQVIKAVTVSNPWIAYRQVQAHAKVKLFCLPYGGGGASLYRDWQAMLPDTIEVCPIQLPGREARLNEAPIGNIDVLVDQLVENLKSELTMPFAFFGHSFGSLIAFELIRALRKQNLAMPMHFFASAFPDPRVPTKSLDALLQDLKAIGIDLFALGSEQAIAQMPEDKLKQLADIFSENGIADYGDSLMNKEIIKVLLPIFIADMGIPKHYHYRDQAPLNLPITVFLGKKDTWVLPEDHQSWRDHTSKQCDIHEFDSGHLFIKDQAVLKQVLQYISRALVTKEVEMLM